jgi:hypothetical protein
MWRTRLTAPRSRPATVVIVVVVVLAVALLVAILYFWVTSTQLRPML